MQANFKTLGRIEIGIVIQLYAEKGEEQYLGVASLEGLCSLLFVLIIITPGTCKYAEVIQRGAVHKHFSWQNTGITSKDYYHMYASRMIKTTEGTSTMYRLWQIDSTIMKLYLRWKCFSSMHE